MTDIDLSTDDNLGASSDELSNQFLHPGYSFKGIELRPYGAGTDHLFNQVLDRNDAPFTIFLSFIFLHLPKHYRKNELGRIVPKREFVALCWDKWEFRSALFDWIDSLGELTNDDKKEAMRLFEEIRGWARKSSVEVEPPEKKTKANRRRRSRA